MRTRFRAHRIIAPRTPIDFAQINAAALKLLPYLLQRWLPGGTQKADEYLARNPRRDDHRAGSFKVNTVTGRWADFAIGSASGGDPISLLAYLDGSRQYDAAVKLAATLGIAMS